MKYSEVIDYLYTKLPVFQRSGPAAYKNSLDNTFALDNYFGNPHRKFKSIHVAGTNGKGSVAHMLAAIFQSAGYKTGLYTSPHLNDFRERIRIDGNMIPENEVILWVKNFIKNNNSWKIEPSFFELTVALAFDYFAKENVDITIVEVGLGGRLDSTNIIHPELSIITNIGLDHTALLGNSIEKIAIEKAGIIKPGVPVIIGKTQKETTEVFKNKAFKLKAPIYFADKEYAVTYSLLNLEGKQELNLEKNGENVYSKLKLDLLGIYQHKNIPAVLKAIEIMQEKGWAISEKEIYEGLSNVSKLSGLMGRWQVIGENPRIICDTAHNIDGILSVFSQIKQTPYKKLHIVFGMVNDKKIDEILALLPENAFYYFTKAKISRALNEKVLAEKAKRFNLIGECYSSVSEAFAKAKENAGKNDLIFIGGSTFVVAEIL